MLDERTEGEDVNMSDIIRFEVGVWYEGTATSRIYGEHVQYFPAIKIIKRTESTVWCVSEYDDSIVYRRKVQTFQYLTEPYKGKFVESFSIKDLDNARFYSTHKPL